MECEVARVEELEAVPYAMLVPYAIVEEAFSFVVHVMVAPEELEEVAIEEIIGGVVSGADVVMNVRSLEVATLFDTSAEATW